MTSAGCDDHRVPVRVDACFVEQEQVRAQAGGFYGGWITEQLVGLFQGRTGNHGLVAVRRAWRICFGSLFNDAYDFVLAVSAWRTTCYAPT